MTEPLPPLPDDGAPASARERRLRAAVAAAEADRRLLDQGLPPADDPRWEGDPCGDGLVVEEYDERQFRLWALQDEVAEASQALEDATAEGADVGAARERLAQARLALGRWRMEDDAPFGHADWRLDLAEFREAGREASRRLAEDADLLQRLAGRVPRTMGDTRGGTPWTSFLQELAVARCWSTRTVGLEVQQARVLTEDLPRVHGALGAGVLAVPAAKAADRRRHRRAAGAAVGGGRPGAGGGGAAGVASPGPGAQGRAAGRPGRRGAACCSGGDRARGVDPPAERRAGRDQRRRSRRRRHRGVEGAGRRRPRAPRRG